MVIVGGGSAGYAAARTARASGKSVAVVEGGRDVGGLCILRGCMPTKALLHAAEVSHLVRKAATWGITAPSPGIDFPAVMERKNRLIREFADYRQKQLTDGRFTFFRAQAAFVDAFTLALSTGETLTADGFVLATGSVVSDPPVPGLKEAGYWTSDDALELTSLPKSLVVLGGGAVAVEFAQFFARMDVEVTLIQRSPNLLRDFDPDAATVVEQVLRRDGIRVITNTLLTGAGRSGDGRRWVSYRQEGREERVEADQVLHALGRSAAVTGLHLERAGVAMAGGRIRTDAALRTSVPHIYAAGDCTGPYEVVHIAIQQGETAASNLVGTSVSRAMDYRLLTSVVFTSPQVAHVGLTEKVAVEQGIDFVTASYPFNDHGKSMIQDELDGFVKLLAHGRTGEILGGCCVGPMGGELIHEIVVAMSQRMTVHQLAVVPHYHPTLAEIWTYPAEELADRIKI